MIAVVVAVAAVAGYAYYAQQAYLAQQVHITNATWNFDYTGALSGYFGSSPASICTNCPVGGNSGSNPEVDIRLVNNDLFFAHTVTSITVALPFSVVSVFPGLPSTIPPSGSTSLIVQLQAPGSGGSYAISGTIVTN